LEVRVTALREEAPGVVSCELRAVARGLPACPPGAHVDVHLPNGLVRQYSVVSADDAHVLIAVKREPASRGGSAYVAESLRIGARLRISVPRDNFRLEPADGRVILVAGGIGITALLPMARRLEDEGRDWALHYAVRSRESAAFGASLRGFGDKIQWYVSSLNRLSITALVHAQPAGTHFYCCGPNAMLNDFVAATAALPAAQVHLERFGPVPVEGGGEFTVRLARSSRVVPVASDQSIVDALAAAGIDVPYSCQQGICGSCEARVLEGLPEHRDDVLTEAEKASNASMMICCSRSRTPELVLDL
jgi:vanillate O-demethylase ferredoxin subunit